MTEVFERVSQSALHLKQGKSEVGIAQVSSKAGAPSRVRANRWERQLGKTNAVGKPKNSNEPTTHDSKSHLLCQRPMCRVCAGRRHNEARWFHNAKSLCTICSQSGHLPRACRMKDSRQTPPARYTGARSPLHLKTRNKIVRI